MIPPNHKMGYTYSYLEEKMGKDLFEDFRGWMYGQTMSVDDNTGETVFYSVDVQQFLSGDRNVYD